MVFISILAGKLPEHQRTRARKVGLGLAMLVRIGLLFSLSWLIRLTEPLFEVFGQEISGRNLILLGGGLFLLFKSPFEIHERLEGEGDSPTRKVGASFLGVMMVSAGWISQFVHHTRR